MGISRIDRERNMFTLFESDGLISTDFNKNTAIKASDGNLYFGTNKGVIYFDPKIINPIDSRKSLVLTDFYLNHKRILPDKGSPLKQDINSCRRIALNYAQNSFALGFSIIDFIHPGTARIEWKLEEFDDDWISYNNTGRINYTNLNSGTYMLKLRIVSEHAEVLADEKQIEFVIKPPFWRTWWAYATYVIATMLLFIAMFYFGKLKIESRKSEDRLHFLINMAHEIKTPLTLIKAPIQDLLTNENLNSNINQNLNIALKSADKLHKQMIRFLDFRRIKEHRKSLLSDDIDMLLFFKEKMLAFKVLCERKNIKLAFNSSVDEFIIRTDVKIIDIVVSNIISNAIKYTEENGEIRIEMSVRNKQCEISVKDTGIGVPKPQQKKIFKLFYRTPEALGTGITGSGVGLVLAYDLAKEIKGKVYLAESSSRGSTFKFSFPYELSESQTSSDEDLVEQVSKAGPDTDDKKTKLLFVEDDEDLLLYSKSKLEERYHIFTASDGKSALDIVDKNMPDIVITDVSMPKMNGRQLCMTLKSNLNTCHIPVVLITGLTSKDNEIQGLESGADAYIKKPVEFDLLIKKIDSLLGNRQILKRKFLQLNEEDFAMSNELDEAFIKKITNYIEENISDPELSVYDLYEITGMSRSMFYHKLKSLIDLSPSEYIRSVRLNMAVTLLKNRNHNISEVAYSVGFSDPKYFSTSFKKHFGQSPSTLVNELQSHGYHQ
jgi:signal transduction histidine kinase/DNA-binding response OmpR family regulator